MRKFIFPLIFILISLQFSFGVIFGQKIYSVDYGVFQQPAELVFRDAEIWFYNLGIFGMPSFVGYNGDLLYSVAVMMDGRPLRNLKSGVIDWNLIPEVAVTNVKVGDGQLWEDVEIFTGPGIDLKTELFTSDSTESRIVYKRGDYNYDNVIVSVAKPLRKNTSILIGGIRKSYEGRYGRTDLLHDQILGKLNHKVNENLNIVLISFYNQRKVSYFNYVAEFNSINYGRNRTASYDHTILLNGYIRGKMPFKLYGYISSYSDRTNQSLPVRFRKDEVYYYGIKYQQIVSSSPGRRLGYGGIFERHKIRDIEYGEAGEKYYNTWISGTLSRGNMVLFGYYLGLQYGIDNRIKFTPSLSLNFTGRGGGYAKLKYSESRSYLPLDFSLSRSWYNLSYPDKAVDYKLYELKTGVQWRGFIFEGKILKRGYSRFLIIRGDTKLEPMLLKVSGTTGIAGSFFFSFPYGFEGSLSYNHLFNGDNSYYYGAREKLFLTLTGKHTFFDDNLKITARFEGLALNGIKKLNYDPFFKIFKYSDDSTGPELVVNFRLTGTIGPFTIFYILENFLSREYELIEGYPMLQKALFFGVDWKFTG